MPESLTETPQGDAPNLSFLFGIRLPLQFRNWSAWKPIPISEIIKNGDLTPQQIQKLQLINDVKQFATDSLAFKPSSSYEKIYDQKGKPILWVVTACEKFSFEEYTWKYPVLGEAGYRGYFNEKAALKELSVTWLSWGW